MSTKMSPENRRHVLTHMNMRGFRIRKMAAQTGFSFAQIRQDLQDAGEELLPDSVHEEREKHLLKVRNTRVEYNPRERYVDQDVVYFIQAGMDGPIKIGFARDPWKRLEELQPGNPYALYLRATLPGGRRTEAKLHQRFAHLRLVGEWFEPEQEISDLMTRIREKSIDPTFGHGRKTAEGTG